MSREKQLEIVEKGKLAWKWTWETFSPSGIITSYKEKFNLIPDVFLVALARQLCGQKTANIGDNIYVALGTSGETPTTADVKLNTEVIRKLAGANFYLLNTGSIRAFFNPTEVSGTYNVFGVFMNGGDTFASSTADSGILTSKVADSVNVSTNEGLITTVSIVVTT